MQIQTDTETADLEQVLPGYVPPGGGVNAMQRIPALRHVLAARPGSASHWLELGNAYLEAGDLQPAERAFRAAVRIDTRLPAANAGLAMALALQGYCMEAAQACFDGLGVDPASMQLQQALVEACMRAGLFDHADKAVRAAVAIDGGGVESATSASALLYRQKRVRDCLEILGKVLECEPRHRQARRLKAEALRAAGRLVQPSGAALALPPESPYLARWQALLKPWQDLKVGLVWAEHRPFPDALLHSLSLIECAPLANLPGVTFFSLQQGKAANEVVQPPEGMDCIPLSDALSSAQDMAAALRQMDLVIAVDCDIARKAATIGCHTWVLLPEHAQASRLPVDEPSGVSKVRLFRQQRRGQWEPVMREVAEALRELVQARARDGLLDDTQKKLLAAWNASEQRRFPEAERLYRELLNMPGDRIGQIICAVRQYMRRSKRYTMLAPTNNSTDVIYLLTDLAAWELARRDRREEAYTLWQGLTELGMPALSILMHYGEAAHQGRDWKRAIEVWEKAMALYPDAPLPPLHAADSYKEQGEIGKAIACLRRSLELSPCQPDTHFKLGCMLRDQGDREHALRHLQLAVHLDRYNADKWLNVGNLYYQEQRYRTAAICFEQANALMPSHYAVLYLGFCAFNLEDFETAVSALDKALRYEPRHRDSLFYKAQSLANLGRHKEAMETLEALRALDPASFDANEVYRKHLFTQTLYNSRSAKAPMSADIYWSGRKLSGTRWKGESLRGKTLLVYQDNGFGDSLQAARYLPGMKLDYKAAKLIYAVWPELHRLYKGIAGVDELHQVFSLDLEKIPCDYYVDEYTLLFLLSVDQVRKPVPYLKAEPALAAGWKAKLETDRNFKIGLVWAGSPIHTNDKRRSMSLRDLQPLSNVPNVSIYALQKGPAVSQAYDLPALRIVTPDNELNDFADTAALMSELDLVISVDSSPAHLAGALGVPVWVMLPALGMDWRWEKGRGDSPWYPSMRLFHQAPEEKWADVVLRVREALVGLLAGEQGRHSAAVGG